MFVMTTTPFSEEFARALDLAAQYHQLREDFDTDLRSDRREYRRALWGTPRDDQPTMSWDVRAARSDQLSSIVKEYEKLWYQIQAVTPALAGVLPLPWQMRTGDRLPDWSERIRRQRVGTAFVTPRAYKPSTTV
ncbi:hypothetical protein OKHIL_76970 [Mycolicibacterium mageritense]